MIGSYCTFRISSASHLGTATRGADRWQDPINISDPNNSDASRTSMANPNNSEIDPNIDDESEQQRPIRTSMANPNNSIPESEQRHSRIQTTFLNPNNIFPNLNNNVEHFQKLFSRIPTSSVLGMARRFLPLRGSFGRTRTRYFGTPQRLLRTVFLFGRARRREESTGGAILTTGI